MKKMTLKKYEKSAADKRADKAGAHGKEGSKKDKMMDKKAVAKINTYSAKAAAKGKDLGKPGKNFAKIASSAGKKYGSKEAGKRVAGAILAKLRKGK